MPGKEGSAGQMRSRRADEITKKEERRNRRRGGCKGFEGSVVCRVLGQWLPGQTGVGSWVPEKHLLTMQVFSLFFLPLGLLFIKVRTVVLEQFGSPRNTPMLRTEPGT